MPARLPRSIGAAVATFAVVIIVAYGIKAVWTSPPPLKALAEHVLSEGRDTPLPVEIADFFHIPHDGQPPIFRDVDVGSHDGRRHSIAARERPNGHIDILLTDGLATGEGYTYLTSTEGRCIMAVYADKKMRPVADAKERFEKEIKNWLEYLESHEPGH